jgi:ADP-ribose pyrophosphatase YjhB (NUDIX family)
VVTEAERPPRNVTAVGGVVIGPEGMLLVRMAYGPTKGRYMIPGGIVDPGETLDEAVVREVLEETGVTARVRGVCAVRTRHDGPNNDTYVLFLLEPVAGEPVSDGRENEDARYFALDELDREDVTDLSAYLGRLAMGGELKVMTLSDDVDWAKAGRDTRSWKLFR